MVQQDREISIKISQPLCNPTVSGERSQCLCFRIPECGIETWNCHAIFGVNYELSGQVEGIVETHYLVLFSFPFWEGNQNTVGILSAFSITK